MYLSGHCLSENIVGSTTRMPIPEDLRLVAAYTDGYASSCHCPVIQTGHAFAQHNVGNTLLLAPFTYPEVTLEIPHAKLRPVRRIFSRPPSPSGKPNSKARIALYYIKHCRTRRYRTACGFMLIDLRVLYFQWLLTLYDTPT